MKQTTWTFTGVLHSMMTFAELEVGGEDVSEALDECENKIVHITIEIV